MAIKEENLNIKLNEILNRLDNLESRVNAIEKVKRNNDISISQEITDVEESKSEVERMFSTKDKNQLLENKFGKYGLVWTGNIVLFFGITFITQHLQNSGFNLLSSIIGFLSVALLFGFSKMMSKNLSYIGLMFKTTSILLLYYFISKLHFFNDAPLLSSKWICLFLLLAINGYQFFLSVKLKSGMFGFIALALTITTAIISNSTHFMLSIVTLTAIVSMYFVFKYHWRTLLIFSIVLVYGTFLIWLLSNPIMGKDFHLVNEHRFSIFYLFFIGSAYTMLTLLPKNENFDDVFVISSVLLNGLGFSFLVLFYVFSFFPTNYVWVFFTVFVFCFCAAAVLKFKSQWKFAAPFYALYSFIMLSVAVYGFYKLPNAFFVLSLESLLVVSMALWFRSQFIVIMNGFLYITLLIVYVKMGNTVVGINFAFAITALITARVLNWQKERLEITTEFLRNAYLVAAFVMMLYALYKALPQEYITLSWTGLALLYYVVSRILNNFKYRWMSIFTFIITAFYLFIVDLHRISMVLRIITFMVLAIISITISIIYANKSNS